VHKLTAWRKRNRLAELERGLTRLGIGTERTVDGRSFEITSVLGKEVFCKRHQQIRREEAQNIDRIDSLANARVREARRQGKTLEYDIARAAVRNELGKGLAQKKRKCTMAQKLAALREQMTPEMMESMSLGAMLNAPRRGWLTPEQAKAEVVFSAFKDKSVANELSIAGELLRATGGAMTLEQGIEFARSAAFIHLDKEGNLTTELVRQEERSCRQIVRRGWNKYAPLVFDPEREIKSERVRHAPDQAASARFIWASRDLVTDVSGIAGSGKTTLLREVVPVLRADGHDVILLAPTSPSERNLKEAFPEAQSLQSFETDLEKQRQLRPGTVIVLDEISMVSMPQACRLVVGGSQRPSPNHSGGPGSIRQC
jgi:hypothetical protein